MSTENEQLESNEVPQTADDAKALLESVERPEAEKSASMPDTQPTAQEIKEYELMVGGKTIKAKEDQILKWAQMGYSAPNEIGTLRKQLDSWTQKEAALKELESRYKTIDDYARQNPQWLQFIQNQYEQTLAQQQQANPLLNEFQTLKQQVDELAQYKNNIVMQQEDQAYLTELESVKKSYPKIDLSTPDETGKSLEYKILEHAQQNGIKKFSTAFKDYMHDELLKMKEEEAKEKLIKDKQAKSKLGILNVSDVPTTKKEFSTKGKSYNQLTNEIIEKYNLS